MKHRPFLEKLGMDGYRSLASALIDFANPTILVGKNGAGKSNIVDAIAFLAECATTPLPLLFERRGGVQAVFHGPGAGRRGAIIGLGASFRFSDRPERTGTYEFQLVPYSDNSFDVVLESCRLYEGGRETASFNRQVRSFQSHVTGLQPRLERDALALPLIGGVEEFAPLVSAMADMRVYSIDPAQIRAWQDTDAGKRLRSDGRNLASVLQRWEKHRKETVRWICDALAAVVPGVTRVIPVKRGRQITLEFTQEWEGGGKLTLEASSMSDGTLRILGILTAIIQGPSPTLIALEEPETSVHPGALGLISDLLEIAARRSHVVVTTQSPDILDTKWIKPEHLRLVEWEKGATHILGVAPHTVSILRDHLMGAGELLRSNALDAAPLDPAEIEVATRSAS